MAVLQLKSHRFRQEREADWRRLNFLLEKVEEQGPKSLTDDQLLAIPVLYRSALSSLSVARATSLDQGLVDYLEGLCARAYFLVYGARPRIGERLAGFFTHGWSAGVRSIWKEFLVSLTITVLAAVVGYMMVEQNPDWFYAMVPKEMAGGRDPAASAASLRATLYDSANTDELSAFAASLFTHNAQITLFAFALGFAFCVPTAMLLMSNGVLLGAMVQVFASKGLGFEFAGWLMIHGVTELLAIIIGGAAGFKIGLAVAFPGDRSRLDAAAEAGRASGAVIAGCVIMLLIAGLLEGLGRQLITSDLVRYTIGIGSGVIWMAYFFLPRPGRTDKRRGAHVDL